MASFDTTAPPYATTEKPVKPSPPPPEHESTLVPVVDVALRVLLFATALVSVIIMVASKQTKLIPIMPGVAIPMVAKFNHSPAFINLLAALSVACLYSIVTGILSVLAVMKPAGSSTKLQVHFVVVDALLLGIVAAATGAAGGVGYIALKGNSHSRWDKFCNKFGSFCSHIAASIFLSLGSSITLLLLVWLSVYALSKKIARR